MAYSTTTERAAASEQLIINAILPDLRGVKPNRSKNGWSFFCPLEHRKKNAPADQAEEISLLGVQLGRVIAQLNI